MCAFSPRKNLPKGGNVSYLEDPGIQYMMFEARKSIQYVEINQKNFKNTRTHNWFQNNTKIKKANTYTEWSPYTWEKKGAYLVYIYVYIDLISTGAKPHLVLRPIFAGRFPVHIIPGESWALSTYKVGHVWSLNKWPKINWQKNCGWLFHPKNK